MAAGTFKPCPHSYSVHSDEPYDGQAYDPKNEGVILLDEATASLDVENETLIQESLSRLIQNKTVMIIAHRMRTVAGADKIVVLADGTVAEEGTPEKLYRENGLYSHMVKLQTESRDWVL